MAIEKTLVLLKPCTLQRGLAGEIIHVFERKGLKICGLKMMRLTDELLSEHYAHLSGKPFFQRGCAGHHQGHLLHELSGEHRACFRLARDGRGGAAPVFPAGGDLRLAALYV